MREFPFSERKAAQAAAFLIERHGGSLNYMKLIKLLYLADRTALLKLHAPITGDTMYSLKYGPVLSRTLDLLKRPDGQEWGKFVAPAVGYDVRPTGSPDIDALSDAEIKILEAVDRKYGGMTEWELSRFTHSLPEFVEPGNSSKRITIEALLKAAGASSETRKRVWERAEESRYASRLNRAPKAASG